MKRFRKASWTWQAVDYAKRVTSGKIPACWQVKASCQRILDDFARTDIVYDEARADHVCDFISNLVHVTGSLAGQPIRLEPFQVFILCNLFGWLKDGLRRYREAFILLPRGNGKSLLAAGVALYMTFADGEYGAVGLSGASSLDQANAVFDPAKWIVQQTPNFADELGLDVSARSIYQTSTNSSLKSVIAKTKDGGIPYVAICDELHQAVNDVQLTAFRTGMGKRRGSAPMLLIITTAGVNLAGVCRQEQLYFESILNKSITDDAKFSLIYTIDQADDWRDFSVWQKANPNWGVSVDEQHLRREYEKALVSTTSQVGSLTKYLNVWCNSASGWLNSVDWANAARPGLKASTSSRAWIAVDLSTKTDITAVVLVTLTDDNKTLLTPYLFLPEGALERSPNSSAYREWIDKGYLQHTPGNASDHAEVDACIRNLVTQYQVESVLFDPWQSATIGQALAADGIPTYEFRQIATVMGPAMRDFEADLMNSRIVHPDNPCLNWMAANISVEMRGVNSIARKPTGQDHLRIDGIVASIMGHAASRTEPPAPVNVTDWLTFA